MAWIPTQHFLHGRIIKPFLPFDKHPSLKNDNFKNLYPGDEVYVFETKDNRWARGYSLTRPFPYDFTITSVNLDDLPGLNIKVVVFPLKYVEVVETLPLNLMEVSNSINNVNDIEGIAPTLKELEFTFQNAVNGVVDVPDEREHNSDKAVIPPLPFNSFTFTKDLVSEITYAMNLLTSHIFALYSIGEFRLFNRLSQIYTDLDEIRITLTHTRLTRNEVQVSKETATYLLSQIPKKLASRAARLNDQFYDLDHKNTDISAYKAILARDTFDGSLLNFENALPSQLAFNQQLCALSPKFPINAHYHAEDYILKPSLNKRLKHDPPSHILVDFKSVSGSSNYQPPGFAGMIAYLYIRNSKKRLTEAFAVHTDTVDELVFVEKISAALFRNIPASEVENNRVYLVAVLTEEIDLSAKEGNMPQTKRVKKGVAAGVADITRIFSRNQGSLATGEPHQFSIKLFGSYTSLLKKGPIDPNQIENNGWGEVVDRIIVGSNHGIAINPRAEKLVITVKEFKHQLTSTEDDNITEASNDANATQKSAPIAKIKPIFFDPLAENYERIYLKMGKVNLLNSVNKEDLLTFEVSAPNNPLITFAKASNQIEKLTWFFVSVFPDEVIGEIVKVNGVSNKSTTKKIPKQDSLLLTLYINGVMAGQGEVMYKSGNRLVEFNNKPFYKTDILSTTLNTPIAQVDIHTEYIGKVFNTEVCIDNIFQYDRFFKSGQQGMDELSKSLIDFCKLDISQLVRFFPELLSSIFAIADVCLQNPSVPSYEMILDNTFKAVVHLLDTVFGKQDQYLYMFDTFLEEYNKSPAVGVLLLNKISEIFAQAQSNWNSMSRSVCRVIVLLIKLALDPAKVASNLDPYVRALTSLFKSASLLISIESPALINDQILVMEIVDFVLDFEDYLNEQQLISLVLSFIDSIGNRGLGVNEEQYQLKKLGPVAKDHKIIITKLLLVYRLFGTKLAQKPENMHLVVSKSVLWCMEIFLGELDVDATRLACSIMNCVCDLMWRNRDVESVRPISFSLTKFIMAMSRTFIKYNKFTRGNDYFKPRKSFTKLFQKEYPFNEIVVDSVVGEEVVVEVLVELATIFVYIAKIGQYVTGVNGLYLINETRIENDFFDPVKCTSNNGLNEDILTVLSGIQIMRLGKYFPEDKWLSLYAMIAEGCLLALELVRPLMIAHFIPTIELPEMFDRSIWGNFFKALMKLSAIAPVSVEHLSTIPRKACHQITGTMRGRIASMVNEAWDGLAWNATEEDIVRFNLTKFGGFQVEFISSDFAILQDLMLFALQRDVDCQAVSVKMLWSILVSEFILSDSIIDVERECLVGLHEIYYRTAYKPGINEQNSLLERMKATIRLDREDVAYSTVVRFISNLAGFLEVLNDLNNVPVGPEFEDDRTFHKLNIKAYLKNANKPELFHSFINQMYEENIRKNDFIQAALSLELLASTYTWDHHTVLPQSYRPKFPAQSSFERKETLVKMIAQNYIKGNSLERATDTYNELLEAYNEHTYDLKSFAYVHQKLAKLYLDLESSDKLSPSFFRVSYIGAGFPANIRGKEQIFEGLPFEHITSIHERLLKLYPGARIITDDEQAREIREKIHTGRYLHVNSVEPLNEYSDKLLNTSIGVRQYARNKNLRFFSSIKKIPGSTSVFDLWTEEVTYETQLSFPTLMNRSDIKSSSMVRLSPLDNAIRTILNKNNDLVQLESMINIAYKEKSDYTSLMNDLSRHLAGTVDAPVNGGVGQYRTFFLDPRYDGKADYAYNIRLLRNAFHDLTCVLSRCLHLHGKLVPSSMKMSHEALVELFKQNFKDEILTLRINTDYDHIPYNHNMSQTSVPKERKVSSVLNGLSSTSGSNQIGIADLSTPSISGSSLQRTLSRNSKVSNNSGSTNLSEPSGPIVASITSMASSNGSNVKNKRTALNWRKAIR